MNAEALVEAIFNDANDRRLFDDVDEETMEEIKAEWLKLALAAAES